MILLDTSAIIWIHQRHRRVRPLLHAKERMYASPVSLLELRLLVDLGRIKLAPRATVSELFDGQSFLIDEPPALAWFSLAAELSWSRDPFDRLLAAHALLQKWRLATADGVLLENLPKNSVFEL